MILNAGPMVNESSNLLSFAPWNSESLSVPDFRALSLYSILLSLKSMVVSSLALTLVFELLSTLAVVCMASTVRSMLSTEEGHKKTVDENLRQEDAALM